VNSFRFLGAALRLALDALVEGRLSLSPRLWLIHIRNLRSQMRAGAGEPESARTSAEDDARRAFFDARRRALETFLESGTRLRFEHHDKPTVSVLLVLYNRAELTLPCLQSLQHQSGVSLDLVIVDNGSTDATGALLARVDGARVLRQTENLGFLRGTNVAAREARGEYLLLLNSDTEPSPGSVAAGLSVLEASPSVGAVGGKLVLPDGRLQEAGSIIWNDGSCLGYGRGDSPQAAEYAFTRDVDFCSAAFLMTPRELFLGIGGFDADYEPAYYEDADYCARLWQAGKRVVYEPRAVVVHVECASAVSADRVLAQQRARRARFVDKHREWLTGQAPPDPARVLDARARRTAGTRVLVVEDRIPHTSTGFGDPRAVALVRALVDLGHFVSVLPMTLTREEWPEAYADVPHEVELLMGVGSRGIKDLLHERRTYYDLVIVSRAHNMTLLRARLGAPRTWIDAGHVIYDAEAITATREAQRRRLLGEHVDEGQAARQLAAEIALARDVDAVLTVSHEEQQRFEVVAPGHVHLVCHAAEIAPTPAPFDERSGVLFVGSFHELSPNTDAVVWFVNEVLPQFRAPVGGNVPMTVVGANPPDAVIRLEAQLVTIAGHVGDLTPLYDRVRVFVAPSRFASGIPLKVIHAAAQGVPVVATSLLAGQLGWQSGRELLVADTPEEFAAACAALHTDAVLWQRVRSAALVRVGRDYSKDAFMQALGQALSSVATSVRAADVEERR
jgi:GT2 family glycosyltransferase